jgi:hypothetical protein
MSIEITDLFVFADHGDLVMALPFVVPPLILIGGLLFLTVRDRRRRRGALE